MKVFILGIKKRFLIVVSRNVVLRRKIFLWGFYLDWFVMCMIGG